MKILRRIFVVIILLLSVFVVCYVVYTCKLIKGPEVAYESLEKSVYKSKNGDVLIFSEGNIWYLTEDITYVCMLEDYENGILKIKTDEQSYSFKVVNLKAIYDMQTEEYLWRGSSG